MPLVIVGEFNSQDEAMRMANDVFLGLTAGFFSQDDREVDCVDQEIDGPIPYGRRRKPIHLNDSEDNASPEDNLDAKDQVIGRD